MIKMGRRVLQAARLLRRYAALGGVRSPPHGLEAWHGVRTTVPLYDLGEINALWAGILSPGYSDALVAKYVHEQFLADAATYVERYQAAALWKKLIRKCQCHFEPGDTPLVLDLGSGGGNSVFALLELTRGPL